MRAVCGEQNRMRTFLTFAVVLWSWQALAAECVTVKYRDTTVCLDSFACTDTPQSSFVRRVCMTPPTPTC